ncbi:MAG TPA: PilZ domain-containing protein [Polyangia bacterium]|jgi:Tfp pilus assembly protein PilZ|nr:PilZ domain-containing protein [Polyangia bacterium]
MEEEPSQPGSERRSSQRYTTRSLVEVRIPTWSALQAVYSVNLSLGGMRLSLGARVSMGAPVDIIMTLPDGERLHLPGKVAYLGTAIGGDVGVRFDVLPDYTQQQIQQYVDELAAGRTPQVRERTKSMPPGVLIKKTS